MFLDALQRQNPQFIDAVLALHAQRKILPDSYVVDVDQFVENARLLKLKADECGIKLYGMTKQFGRNPALAKMLIELGYEGIVAVDFKEARTLARQGVKIAHVGHLVQPPSAMIDELLTLIKPEIITVYSIEKAAEIAERAVVHGVTQNIMVKFYDEGDHLYVNQESGFHISEMAQVLAKLSQLPNLRLAGITHFPCFLYNGSSTEPTHNFSTLLEVKKRWPKYLPSLLQVNAPSSTNCETIPQLGAMGCTHGEPGHALTGTFPSNKHGDQPEKIAMLYLSEISHQFGEDSYCYGGGYYRRGHLECGLIEGKKVAVSNDDESSIDYHLKLKGQHQVGTPVVMSFRTQVFVTRSDIVLVKGIAESAPRVIGVYSALGELVDG